MSHGKLFYRLADGTNGKVVHEFFESMARVHNLKGSVIVLDNHAAHYTLGVQELLHDLGAELLFTPPASSILNPIEVGYFLEILISFVNINLITPFILGTLGGY